jgi:hypothetical protein
MRLYMVRRKGTNQFARAVSALPEICWGDQGGAKVFETAGAAGGAAARVNKLFADQAEVVAFKLVEVKSDAESA